MIPGGRYYTPCHEWVRLDGECVEVGVTEPILRKLRPLVGVCLLDADDEMKMGLPFGELEGISETLSLYAPVEASILEVNEEVVWNHAKLLKDPYGKGWLLRIQVHDPQQLKGLLTAAGYRKHCARELGRGFAR